MNGAMSTIRPPRTATSAMRVGLPVPSTTIPLRMIKSKSGIACSFSSYLLDGADGGIGLKGEMVGADRPFGALFRHKRRNQDHQQAGADHIGYHPVDSGLVG